MDQELKDEFQKLNQRFDGMEATVNRIAVQVANLTEDTAAIREAMPSKELINRLYNSSNVLAKEVIGYRTEQAAIDHRITKVENWITKAAPNVGVAFQQ